MRLGRPSPLGPYAAEGRGSPSILREAAQAYANLGLWVLPLEECDPDGECSCGDSECGTPGKHLRGAPASRRRTTLRRYWRDWPSANLGLPTGPKNGLVVLDVDPLEGGLRTLRALEDRHGRFPDTFQVRTGSGGTHFYFLHPGKEIASRNGWGPGMDIRADHGYVVAPPSRHPSGYRYVFSRIPRTLRPAPLPPWLLHRLLPGAGVEDPA